MTLSSTPNSQPSSRSRRAIGIVGKSRQDKHKVTVETEASQSTGILGFKTKAHWEGIGVLPLFFVGFGFVALAIKMLKVKSGEWSSGPSAVNKVTVPKTAITSSEEEAELHVFKCGGCGYEMYPARGREFKFFPDSFKCPLCGTPKSEFWDLNDPDDPRNQEEEEEQSEEEEDSGEDGAVQDVVSDSGSTESLRSESGGGTGNEGTSTTAKDRTDSDTST
ncbi:unnamed protein product [Agarophyton chilense]